MLVNSSSRYVYRRHQIQEFLKKTQKKHAFKRMKICSIIQDILYRGSRIVLYLIAKRHNEYEKSLTQFNNPVYLELFGDPSPNIMSHGQTPDDHILEGLIYNIKENICTFFLLSKQDLKQVTLLAL